MQILILDLLCTPKMKEISLPICHVVYGLMGKYYFVKSSAKHVQFVQGQPYMLGHIKPLVKMRNHWLPKLNLIS